ncbi:hypothetical protein AKJ62_01280 [candidate division MSBL1 archaeon SCGC-AAA259D14]|uniref:DNA/RNA-binding protein Alba-like domain-containing protein n=1 Tax=candidate division MSBL1 archaeon SCGC-AAA259D14 TaxID=1698261 RepID=A0A133U7U7_9EURY|nr:hypothetical protein AKJ62_01280 [candidate division MSBL1 archaeon SCGC-AAA259D14]
MEEIRIGQKSKGKYLSAVFYAFQNNHSRVVVSGLGKKVSKAFDVCEEVTNLLKDVHSSKSESFEVDGKTGVRITLEKEGIQ